MGKLRLKGVMGLSPVMLVICALLLPTAVVANSVNTSVTIKDPTLICGEPLPLNPFAGAVVSSDGPFGPSPYDDPNALLGKPTTRFKDPYYPPTERAKLVEPAWNVGLSDEPLITTLNYNAGPPEDESNIIVEFDHDVLDNPANPYGIDLIVFGNSFFTGSGFVDDSTDMNTYMLTGGGFFENIKVSVSPDGSNWYRYESGPYGDGMFPTQAYEWDRANAQWTDNEMNWTKPVNPALTLADFNSISAADAIDLYGGSAGGTGFDLVESGFASIRYVKVEGVSGFSGGEIDGFADVAPITTYPDWDVNEDGAINIADVSIIGGYWGETGAPGWIRADVNDDGVVDIADVSIIGGHWGE